MRLAVDTIGHLIGDLVATRLKHRALGLAAVQVGMPLRVVALSPVEFGGCAIVINPEIVEASDKFVDGVEGCLSIERGTKTFQVRRPKVVTVRFIDRNGTEREHVAKGIGARLIQHEIDHLDGRLISDPR